MWENTVEPVRQQMTIRRMPNACWVRKSTSAHSEYVIIIDSPLQQWLHRNTSMLHYTFIDYHFVV